MDEAQPNPLPDPREARRVEARAWLATLKPWTPEQLAASDELHAQPQAATGPSAGTAKA